MIYKVYGIEVHKEQSILQAEKTIADKDKAMQTARKWLSEGLQAFILEIHTEIPE